MLHSSLRRIPDLWAATYDLVAQVPRGRVTTYGMVARALGDVVASRFVGLAMSRNDDIVRVPCRRVVQSDGRVGGYTAKEGQTAKIDALRREGVEVIGDRILAFDETLFRDFDTDYPLKRLRRIQSNLRKRLEIPSHRIRVERVVGVDVSYDRQDRAFAAAVVYDMASREAIGTTVVEGQANFPYVPTYLAFRELPLLGPVMANLGDDTVLMYDGNGILHPEGFGIASHCGVAFGVPTIGVAKSQLCGTLQSKGRMGARAVRLGRKTAGYALSHLPGGRPVYVSPGAGISLRQSLEIVKACTTHRIPEPTRLAHIAAEAARRSKSHK